MSTTKNESKGLAMPILAAGAVILAGASGYASAAGQEHASHGTDGQSISMQAQSALTLHNAMLRAGEDKEFARELLSNPEKFRGKYNLTDSQINALKSSREVMEAGESEKDFNYTLS